MLLVSERVCYSRSISFNLSSCKYTIMLVFFFVATIIIYLRDLILFIIIKSYNTQLLFTFWGVFSCKFVNYDTERANDMTAIGLFWKSVPLDWSYNSYTTDYDEVERVEVVGACSPFNWFGESIIQYDCPIRAARGFGLVSLQWQCICFRVYVTWWLF